MRSNHTKHLLIMLACCLIPVAAFTAITIFRVPASNVLLLGMGLLCPILHLVMMRYMLPGHNHTDHAQEHFRESDKVKAIR